MTNHCLGLCCADFTLEEPEITEHQAMLIPLETEFENGHHFSCINWDPETYQCGIYETRPLMCKNFPEEWLSKRCWVEGCTHIETEPQT